MGRFSDDRVIEVARQAIDLARLAHRMYAAGNRPLSSSELSALLVRTNCHEEEFPFPGDDVAFTLPRVNGINIIAINRRAARTDRRFAVRHELYHVLCGEVDEITYLSDHGYMSISERAADLFALSDLIPGEWIRLIRRECRRWAGVLDEVRGFVVQYAESWPNDRVEDRARLRLRLYRECGI